MTDAVRRALRTFIQSFIGAILASGILSVLATDGIVDLSLLGKTLTSALVAGIIALVSFVQNFLEDSNVIPEVVEK